MTKSALYKNTDNEGFMEIVGITLITRDNIDIALAKAAIEKTNFGRYRRKC